MNNEAPTRLLLVEDSRGDAMVVQALIAEAGRRTGTRYQVDHVTSWAAATAKLAEHPDQPYDAALLDLGLPDSEGVGTVGQLSDRYPSMAVVVMTARDDAECAIDAVASGAQDYLPKGKVRPEELARVLSHAILRRRMEQTLRESESEHRALFDCNPNPAWVCERGSLRILAVNEAAMQHYGWNEEQFLSMRLSDLVPADQFSLLLDYLEEGAGRYGERIWRHRSRGGTEVQVQLAAHALRFYGHPAILVMTRNLTDSTRLTHALSVAEQRYDALFSMSPGLLLEHDLEGAMIRVNAPLAALLGYPAEALAKASLRALVPAQATSELDSYLQTLRIHATYAGSLPFMGRDGKRRMLRLRSRRFDDAERRSSALAVLEFVG